MELLRNISGSLVAEITLKILVVGGSDNGNNRAVVGHVAHPPPAELTASEIAELVGMAIPALLCAQVVAGSVDDILDFLSQKTRIEDSVLLDFAERQLERQAEVGCKADTADVCCVVDGIAKVPLKISNH